MLRRVRVDKDIERKITTAFITSTDFTRKTLLSYRSEFMEVEYARKVIGWVVDYFNHYQKSPGIHIQDIYETEKESLKEEEADTIEVFLKDISDEYEKTDVMNVDYLADQAKSYFRKRSLEILFEKGEKFAKAGKIEEAEKLLLEHKQVSKITSGTFDPFDKQRIRHHLHNDEMSKLFSLPGDLGNLIGPMRRGWLMAVMAPEKRGKSWLLEELVFHALIARLKVFWVSLEMPAIVLEKRIYQKLTGKDTESRDCLYPVLDCINNQDSSCLKKDRICDVGIFDSEGNKKEFDRKLKYTPCSVCRGKKDYIPAYWKKYMKTAEIKTRVIEKKADLFTGMYGRNLRIRSFPRFDASIQDIINEVNHLEYSENFLPDVLVIDYLDILTDPRGYEGRDAVDYKWKTAARIAGMKNCLVITADQSDAGGRKKRSLDDSNFSEDKRKDAHLDMRVAINQTMKEKYDKVARISVLFHRHEYFHPRREVLILQELSLGQPVLDSIWWSIDFEK